MTDDADFDFDAFQPTWEKWLSTPLPPGLAVLALETECVGYGHGYEKLNSQGGPGEDIEDVLGPLGYSSQCFPGHNSCFGSEPLKRGTDKARFRHDIIGPPALLQTFPALSGAHRTTNSKIFADLRHLEHDAGSRRDCDHVFFRGASIEKMADNGFEGFIKAATATTEDFARLNELLAVAGGNVATAAAMLRRASRQVPPPTFLVRGLIPDGAISLLLGNRKAGKSTALLELCVAAAAKEAMWLGFEIDHSRRGQVFYLSGEDSEAVICERVRRMTGGETPYPLCVIPANGSTIDETLDRIVNENPRLVVVDPARSFFRGDEDGSDAVGHFFEKLQAVAAKANCPVVVAHHLKRNAAPRNVGEVADSVRGSGVFLDRPRVTLGLLRQGGDTLVGISGPPDAPLHNFPSDIMFSGVRRLRRDEKSHRHVPLDRTPTEAQSPSSDDSTTVLAAMVEMETRKVRITRTGKSELYNQRSALTSGMPRAKVRAAVDQLVRAGNLTLAEDGAITVAKLDAAPSADHPSCLED